MAGDLFYSCGCAGEGGGIFLCRETETAGKIETLALAPLPGANYHCFHGNFLYSTWNVAGKGGGAAAFRINEDNTLTELNRMEACGVATCHVTTSPDGAYLYAANYLTGTFAEFKLAADGSIAERTQIADHNSYPVGPRTDRQECAHTHCTRFTPDGKWLCVVDLGVDRVFLYPYQAGKGIDVDGVQIFVSDPGDGPRHIIFDVAGTTAYIVNELGNSVTCCSYSNGKLVALGKYTSLPENCTATTKAAAIRFSPDERFLFASNRGYDSIACYRIVKPGVLALYDIVDAHGDSPRDINFLPSGTQFAVSNEFSDKICLFSYDPANGKLSYLEGCDITDEPRPLCIEWQ